MNRTRYLLIFEASLYHKNKRVIYEWVNVAPRFKSRPVLRCFSPFQYHDTAKIEPALPTNVSRFYHNFMFGSGSLMAAEYAEFFSR